MLFFRHCLIGHQSGSSKINAESFAPYGQRAIFRQVHFGSKFIVLVADVTLDDSQIDETGLLHSRYIFCIIRGDHVDVNIRTVVEKYSREAQALDPGRSEAYSALAQAYALQSRWTELEAVLAKAEKNDSDDLDPYYQAGKALLLQGGDMARAERFFRKYLRQEAEGERPDLASAHWRLGLVLEKQGRKEEAVAEVEKALQIKPDFEQAKKDLKRLK